MPNLEYISVDLESPIAALKINITDMKFSSNVFDCVIRWHVLEHIPDDRRAMREILRVLKPGGWAILQVPIMEDKTYEDPNVTSPEGRDRICGQRDHVRSYGLDYEDRLQQAGFKVKVDDYVKQLGDRTIRKYGLRASEDIYICLKPDREEVSR